MFRIKICGITTVEDALAAAAAGADAIGLNFYAQSPRCIDLATACSIVQATPPHVAKVGVFVNESSPRMIQIADQLALDFVQLHGDEPPDQLAGLAPRQAIRAFRMSGDYETLLTYLRVCRALGYRPTAVLIDAYKLGIYGGTGKTADWAKVHEFQQHAGGVSVVLSGGLNPENVGAAIARARPAAVDVASGVEVSPGRKDAARMGRFVDAARRAWQALSPD